MTKGEARAWIRDLRLTGTPIHPQVARRLYEVAELPCPIPEPYPPTDEEQRALDEMRQKIENALFNGR